MDGLGATQAINTLTGWHLSARHGDNVVIEYRKQRTWELGLALSGATLAACLWLVVVGTRRRRTVP